MKTKHLLFSAAIAFLSHSLFSQIPILNSNPGITNKVIYLDFDGQVVSGTSWNSGNTVNALPSTLNSTQMRNAWQRVMEDYRPFDVNITTDSVRFNNAPPNKRMRVVITPTSAWYTNPPNAPANPAGGVAFVGSFAWGGTPGTPCWIFENELGYSAKDVGEACSHEAGHTLSLKHHSTYSTTPSGTCTKTAEYDPGQGSGVTGWAPIMGVGYYKNVTTWYNGVSTLGCNVIQNDISNQSTGITGTPYLSFLPDDVGDTYANAKILNLTSQTLLDSGIITTPTDMDAYQFSICNNRYVSFNIKPWAIDTTTYDAANLDVRFMLYSSSNSILLVDTPLTKLYALKGTTLAPGSYYFTVDGGRSANYSDYGSIGKYYVRIKATNPPALGNTISLGNNICLNQSVTLNYTSNGTPASWLWTINDPAAGTTTINTQNPPFTFNTAGVYTITLLASSSASASCPVTQTVGISAAPVLSLSGGNAICTGSSTSISASGASNYLWQPGSFSGSVQVVNPTVTTVYTVTGSNNLCNTQGMVTVTVFPNFTLQASASTTICAGDQTTITVTGAPHYTINPGGFVDAPAIVAPFVSTQYFITGSNGTCSKSTTRIVALSPLFSIQAAQSRSLICKGESVSITASGAVHYAVNPGNITAMPAVVSPTVPTMYTVTGFNTDNCPADTIIPVTVVICTGIDTHQGNAEVSIYPNPASGNITVVAPAGCNGFEITNALGSLVFEQTLSETKTVSIASDTWANGLYLLKARFAGNETLVKKIVIQH